MQAIALAFDLAPIQLGDALRLLCLIRANEPEKYDRAAVRWHARFVLDTAGVTFADSRLALQLLDGHANSAPEAMPALIDLCHRYGIADLPPRVIHSG